MSKYCATHDTNFKCVLNSMKVFLEFASTQQLWKAIDSRDEGTVRTLLERGADPDLKNLAGQSALHLAAMAESEPITQLLLDESCKINVNAKDKHGNTALRWAVLHGYHGIVFCFVLIILYSLYLEYDSPLVPSASGLAG